MKKINNILLADPSEIILNGLKEILRVMNDQIRIETSTSADDLEMQLKTFPADIVVMNPSFLPEQLQNNISNNYGIEHQVKYACLLYSYFDDKVLRLFDEAIYITDSTEEVIQKIQGLVKKSGKQGKSQQEVQLSPREIEVLKYLVKGHSNKEISNLMFISTHTVISHRKNITAKLGVKSVAGLTVYAILNKIISEDEIRDYFEGEH